MDTKTDWHAFALSKDIQPGLKHPFAYDEEIDDFDDPFAPRSKRGKSGHRTSEDDDVSTLDGVDEASSNEDQNAGREHYVDPGKSRLRKLQDGLELGHAYEGTSRRRAEIEETDDENGDGEEAEDQDEVGGEGVQQSKRDLSDSGPNGEVDSSDLEMSGEEPAVDPDEVDVNMSDVQEDEEVDSDEAFGEGEEELFERKGFIFRENGRPAAEVVGAVSNGASETSGEDESMDEPDLSQSTDLSDNFVESSDEDDYDGDDINNDSDAEASPLKDDDRATLRKMMADEQKAAVASVSQAAKADVAKGMAVKQQKSTFNNLINTRIQLQNAIIATNSLATLSAGESVSLSEEDKNAVKAAEEAALNLWNTISDLRASLPFASEPSNKKRRLNANTSTSLPSLIEETTSLNSDALRARRSTLTKWSRRTQPASAQPIRNKLTQTTNQQSLISVIDLHLSEPNISRLISRTRTPRAGATNIPNRPSPDPTSPPIYDDTDFYTLLLRDFVDEKRSTASASTFPSINFGSMYQLQRATKLKRVVDTKASKGKKLRYEVHEKLQNFMAPEDKGDWTERAREELFHSLLGQRRVLEEEERSEGSVDELSAEAEALRLFQGQ